MGVILKISSPILLSLHFWLCDIVQITYPRFLNLYNGNTGVCPSEHTASRLLANACRNEAHQA